MNYLYWFAGSALINFIAFVEFWVFRALAKQQYENLRNYLMRNSGFGYLLIRYPEGRMQKVFIKLTPNMEVNKERYILKHERVFYFEGMPSLLYNKGDAQPIDIADINKSDDLWRNAEFIDNLVINVKAAAEAEAEGRAAMLVTLVWVILIIAVLSLCATGYLVYMLNKGGAAGVITAQV